MTIIDQVVNEFVNQGRAFTAFEVSLEAKKRGMTERHRNVKDYIHKVMIDEMAFGNYRRTLITIGDGALQAFLYHENTFDPKTYKEEKVINTPSKQPDIKELDYRNRLLIPINDLGLKAGELLHIFAENNVLFLTKDKPKDINTQTKMVEDKFYLYDTTLQSAGLTGKKVSIETGMYKGYKAIEIRSA